MQLVLFFDFHTKIIYFHLNGRKTQPSRLNLNDMIGFAIIV